MATSGTPIRLVREDGELIELNATKIVMSTDRRFGPKSFPFTGSNRVSLDLNLNKAVILIQGFFSDDEIAVGGKKAVATVDFNVTTSFVAASLIRKSFTTATNIEKVFASSQNTKLTLKDSNGTDRVLNFVATTSGSNSYNSGTQTVTIRTDATPAQIATQVKSGLDTSYSSYFTTSIVDGDATTSAGGNRTNSKLVITQVSDGVGGNSSSPFFTLDNKLIGMNIPKTTDFAGGKTASRKSAGDKAQDMYSIMNNSSRSTFRAAGRSMINMFTQQKNEKDLQNRNKASDYIVGIQIPFNSILTDGDYTPRNFFMPTGFYDKNEKTSESAKAAGTEFSGVDNFTGISGGMKSMEIMYDAGEAIYTFDMQFLPSDVMI
jgi:hypothetical protein